MDCNTARIYLQLGGTDALELQQHLGECSSCHHLAQDMKLLDEHLGRAMRAVEVPQGLKQELLQRFASEHRTEQRRWVRYSSYGVAVAAVVLFAWSLYLLVSPTRSILYGEQVVRDFNILRPDQESSNAQLKLLGARGRAPSFVNYAYLCGEPSLAILPGTQDDRTPVRVPQFCFASGDRRAVVYVVPRGKYTVEGVESADPAYPWQLQIEEDEENWGYLYFILHTGKDWRWLRQIAHGE